MSALGDDLTRRARRGQQRPDGLRPGISPGQHAQGGKGPQDILEFGETVKQSLPTDSTAMQADRTGKIAVRTIEAA
jgi:hypothetical protein